MPLSIRPCAIKCVQVAVTLCLPTSQVVEELVSNLGVIEKLTFFEHKDANGKDWGLNVRQRAKELVALVNDPERMRAERQKVSS